MTIVLFPEDPIEPRKADQSFAVEYSAAKEVGFDVSLVSQGLFDTEMILRLKVGSEDVIYRGWILKQKQYEYMVEQAVKLGHAMIQTMSAYFHVQQIPCWIPFIENTPATLCKSKDSAGGFDFDNIAFEVEGMFGDGPVIIKDWTKSQKHYWHEACFVPHANDKEHLLKVIKKFIELQGDDLVGGIAIRKFEKFKQIGVHPKSNLPLVNEHRYFVGNGKVFAHYPYWEYGQYINNGPSDKWVQDAVSEVGSLFFSVDVAEKENGEWMIIEVGDGGSSGIPGADNENVLDFYKKLKEVF